MRVQKVGNSILYIPSFFNDQRSVLYNKKNSYTDFYAKFIFSAKIYNTIKRAFETHGWHNIIPNSYFQYMIFFLWHAMYCRKLRVR
jgi:hypothetical protein